MKHIVKIYPGEYEIQLDNNVRYLYQAKKKITPKDVIWDDRLEIVNILQSILELDIDNNDKIIGFLKKYGLLVNVLNDPELPTYLGLPIPLAYHEYVTPFNPGIGMPLYLFRHSIKLLKDLLFLSTELSKYYDINRDDDIETIKKILELFLSILFQPYTLRENPTNLCSIVDGVTPLSDFAYCYHMGFGKNPPYFSAMYLNIFITSFKDLVTDNRKQMNNTEVTPGKQISEKELLQSLPKTLELSNPVKGTIAKFPKEFGIYTVYPEYLLLSDVLLSLIKYCNFSFEYNDTVRISFINEEGFLSDTQLIENLCALAKKLVIGTLNTYTSNIQIELTDFNSDELAQKEYTSYQKKTPSHLLHSPPMYSFAYRSKCLLQALFHEASSMLNEYGVSTCKYAKCNQTIFYKHTRPKQCCCHKHLDNYLKIQKRKLK